MKKLIRLMLAFALTAAAAIGARAEKSPEKYTYVIVHGATAGGWEWKRAGQFLLEDGHTVYRATLTGLGERMHLATAEVDLETHIKDVVNLILFEDLHDVVLVGHSYGGMVITGVMDRIPERIRHVIFLDAVVPDDGQSAFDIVGGTPPGAKEIDGLVYFPWFDPNAPLPRSMPHPIKSFKQKVSYKNPQAKALPVTYVAFVPADQSAKDRAATDKNWQRAESRGWTIRTFPGHHVAHQENPRGVATLVEEAVKDQNKPVAPVPAPANK
jgi:pimeloyl-ACP methyl ester carboxylesterase